MDDAGNIVHPLLASPPVLALWRAPTDNDRIGGQAAAWDAVGLDHLERRLVSLERDDGAATVLDEVTTRAGIRITHERRIHALPDGGIGFTETVTVPDTIADLPRVGISFETVPGLEHLEWFGTGRMRPIRTANAAGSSIGTARRSRISTCPTSGRRRTAATPTSAGSP